VSKKTYTKTAGEKAINDILRACEKYNRENNKLLSYGQYVALLYQERIKKRSLKK
jgi:hypothetical protein